MKKTKQKIKVVQDPDNVVPAEILAKDIVALSKAAKGMLDAGLKEETIVLLLNDATRVTKPDIRSILRALPDLASRYTNRT